MTATDLFIIVDWYILRYFPSYRIVRIFFYLCSILFRITLRFDDIWFLTIGKIPHRLERSTVHPSFAVYVFKKF